VQEGCRKLDWLRAFRAAKKGRSANALEVARPEDKTGTRNRPGKLKRG
jgi:hypothetical protein